MGITFYNFSKSETISERKRERGKKRRKEGKEEESQYENSILNVKKKHTCFQLIFIYELKKHNFSYTCVSLILLDLI